MKWDDERFIAFDFETTGTEEEYALQPWRLGTGDFEVTSLVWRSKDNNEQNKWVSGGGLYPTKADIEAMLDYAIENRKTLCAWNAVFDISILLAYGLGDKVFRCDWLDGMLLWRHCEIEPEYDALPGKRKSYGLKKCVEQYMPTMAGYEEDIDFHDNSPEAREKLHKYNVKDVIATFTLTGQFYEQLQANPQQLRAALIEAKCLPLVARANLEGMLVDTLAVNETAQYLTDTANALLGELESQGVTEKVVRSPAQLSELFFKTWGLTPIKHSDKTGTPSTDKETLHELSLVDDRVAKVRSYRECLNNRKKFCENIVASARYNEDNRTRPAAIVFGTYSGRLTYSSSQGRGVKKRQTGFALHQMKRDKMYRAAILPPDGHTLIEFDAAGQEFRWMAIASGDETMLSLCLPGEDPHSFMGAQIWGKDYREFVDDVHAGKEGAYENRQLGKVANLSLQYRTSYKKLRSVARVQYGLDMSLSLAKRIYGTYRQAYPGVPLYWGRQIKDTREKGYVETLAGRRVTVVGNWEGNLGWSMGSTAINYRIQGTGADQKYLALAMLKQFMLDHNIRFGWDLHDGIYLYVPDKHVERVIHQGRNLLYNLPYEKAWGFKPPIPLPWDCKVGGSWGTLKEVNYD